jgi:hypothetical protein
MAHRDKCQLHGHAVATGAKFDVRGAVEKAFTSIETKEALRTVTVAG